MIGMLEMMNIEQEGDRIVIIITIEMDKIKKDAKDVIILLEQQDRRIDEEDEMKGTLTVAIKVGTEMIIGSVTIAVEEEIITPPRNLLHHHIILRVAVIIQTLLIHPIHRLLHHLRCRLRMGRHRHFQEMMTF
jgi:hypothetical protein